MFSRVAAKFESLGIFSARNVDDPTIHHRTYDARAERLRMHVPKRHALLMK
jgi:hypothetical protein